MVQRTRPRFWKAGQRYSSLGLKSLSRNSGVEIHRSKLVHLEVGDKGDGYVEAIVTDNTPFRFRLVNRDSNTYLDLDGGKSSNG